MTSNNKETTPGIETNEEGCVSTPTGENHAKRPNFFESINDRKLPDIEQIPDVNLTDKETESLNKNFKGEAYKMAMLWHCRFSHASLNYLKKFQSMYIDLKDIKGFEFDEAVKDCEVCKFAKIKRKPFIAERTRASRPRRWGLYVLLHSRTVTDT